MSTDAEWREAFGRIDRGETSYRDEAKRLGTNPATFQRRYLNYLESRVGLVRGEHARLEGVVASTKEKLDGLAGKYEKKNQELAVESARKKRVAEAEFQGALKSLRAKLAGEEVKLKGSLTGKEQESKRRLERIDAEIEAKNAVITEFKKRGLEPTRGLELLKEHEDLCGELSRMGGLLESVNSSIEASKRQQHEEDRVTASQRKEAAKRWEDFIDRKKGQSTELSQRIDEKVSREKRLNEKLSDAGRMIDAADQTLSARQRQIRDYDQQIPDLKKQFEENFKMSLFAQDKKFEMEEKVQKAERLRNESLRQAGEYQRAVEKSRRELEEIEKGKEEAVRITKELVEKKVKEMVHETREEAERRNKLDETLKSEVARAKGLEANVKDLRGELESTTGELKSLKKYKVGFVDGKKLTLEETKEALIEAHNNEIEKRTGEKFQKLKSSYEARLPKLVHERLVQILNKPNWPTEIVDVINIRARARADGILQNKREWPSWFMKLYLEEVSTRLSRELDDEFDRRVDTKSQEIAEGKLERLKNRAWPEWFSKNVKPVIDRDVFKALGGSWTGWRCDKCGAGFGFTLAEHDIGELLRNGWIEIACTDPNCIDYGWLGWRNSRHKIKITLERLIARSMERTVELIPVKKAASVAGA